MPTRRLCKCCSEHQLARQPSLALGTTVKYQSSHAHKLSTQIAMQPPFENREPHLQDCVNVRLLTTVLRMSGQGFVPCRILYAMAPCLMRESLFPRQQTFLRVKCPTLTQLCPPAPHEPRLLEGLGPIRHLIALSAKVWIMTQAYFSSPQKPHLCQGLYPPPRYPTALREPRNLPCLIPTPDIAV